MFRSYYFGARYFRATYISGWGWPDFLHGVATARPLLVGKIKACASLFGNVRAAEFLKGRIRSNP